MLDRRDSLLILVATALVPSLAKAAPVFGKLAESIATKVAVTANEPLSDRGLENLVAYTRLLGYVRHFHPSDQAAAADWQTLAVEGAWRAEPCADAETLARTLTEFFAPVAPAVQIFVTGNSPSIMESGFLPASIEGAQVTGWIHVGPGQDAAQTKGTDRPYASRRLLVPLVMANTSVLPLFPAEPYEIELSGGISCRVPLALFVDAQGTVPRSAPAANRGPDLPADSPERARAVRFASVALAWNAIQHFYPYFHVVRVDWLAELPRALRSAATDMDEPAFRRTLLRLTVAFQDGHGQIFPGPSSMVPLRWEWIENKLVITHVPEGKETGGVVRGDIVVSIDGVPAAQVVTAKEALTSGATPQWRRTSAVFNLMTGERDSSMRLVIEHANGQTREVSVQRSESALTPSRFTPIFFEPRPGMCYFDLDWRSTPADFEAALPKLLAAKALIFDMRSYPNDDVAGPVLMRLTDRPLQSATWKVPLVTRPDRSGPVQYAGDEYWRREWMPATPRFLGRAAFLTDGRALSTADSYMGIVEAYHLGEIVGGPTAGTTGNAVYSQLPSGHKMMWTGMRVIRHDGTDHHGHGIVPTVPVSPTIRGIRDGRDEVLERAIAMLGG